MGIALWILRCLLALAFLLTGWTKAFTPMARLKSYNDLSLRMALGFMGAFMQISAPPKNWKELVNRAEHFHIVGVWAAVLAFACFLTAVALKLAVH